MRFAGRVFIVLGMLSLLFALALLSHNQELAAPGPAIVPSAIQQYWRLLLGAFSWGAAVWLSAAWITLRRLHPLAWLAQLVPLLLVAPVVIAGILVPSALIALLVGVGVVAVLTAATVLITEAINGAARRRQAIKTAQVASREA